MGAMSPMHWLIVIAVLLLLFGAKKLPEMARSVGQSARVFKGEMKGLKDDEAAAGRPVAEQPVADQPKAVEPPAPAAPAPVAETPAPVAQAR